MNPQALIVDDEPDILELLTMTLSGMSIDCVPAENLTQAKQALFISNRASKRPFFMTKQFTFN